MALPLLEFLLLRVFLLISCDNYTVAGPGIPVVACIPAVACKPAGPGILVVACIPAVACKPAGPGIPVVAWIPAVACIPAVAGIPAFADSSAFADLFTLSFLLLPAS